MSLIFDAYDATTAARLRAGGPDAHDQPAERVTSDGQGNPCRVCLQDVPEGAEMLIAAARPFVSLHPFAETGPVFLCAAPCMPWAAPGLPPVLRTRPTYLVKAYGADERIVYGTGRIVSSDALEDYAASLFDRVDVAFVDVRSATNNCFLTRVRRPR